MVKKHVPKITQQRLEREYCKVAGVTKFGSETDRRGVVMLACCSFGPTVKAIQAHLSYPASEIRECLKRLKNTGILKKGKLHVDWFKKDGGLSFCLDAATVEGWLQRKG